MRRRWPVRNAPRGVPCRGHVASEKSSSRFRHLRRCLVRGSDDRQFEDPQRQPIGMEAAHDWERDVIDGNAGRRFALRRTTVGVAMEYSADAVAVERFFEAAGAEEGKDLLGLADDGVADGSVVQEGDAGWIRHA